MEGSPTEGSCQGKLGDPWTLLGMTTTRPTGSLGMTTPRPFGARSGNKPQALGKLKLTVRILEDDLPLAESPPFFIGKLMAPPKAAPQDAAAVKLTLEHLREIQAWGASFDPPVPSPGATAPDYCLGASRFTLGKLVGLFPRNSHLNGFLGSATGGKSLGMESSQVRMAWGRMSPPESKPDLNPKADFADTVLPAAIRWGKVRASMADEVEFVVMANAKMGDQLLAHSTPISVGVGLEGGKSRDHFVTLAPDRSGNIWAIDSWDSSTTAAVVQLPADFKLESGATVDMNAGETRIPSAKPWIGYYRNKRNKAPLTMKIAL